MEKGGQLGKLKETVGRARKYFDEVVVMLEGKFGGSPEGKMKVVKWCEKKGYNYIEHDEEEAEANEKLAKRLGLQGAEFMLWLDVGDTETDIEQTIIENIQKSYFKPRVWGEREICYYANFGIPSIERWSSKRLETGLGGSETAVVRLSQEWTKIGYRVTVYGDPGTERGEHEGVSYLPWYEFNIFDFFNIFIQWRGVFRSELAVYVKSRQYYMDMHDIYDEKALAPNVHAMDKVMVKSQFHRGLAPDVTDNKFRVIGNGI